MTALIQHPVDPCSVILAHFGEGLKTETFDTPEQAKAFIALSVAVCGGSVMTMVEFEKAVRS